MNNQTSTQIAFLAGRIVLGGFYLYYGLDKFIHLGFLSGYAASKGVPLPQLAVIGAGILLTIGGLSFITGYKPRIGVAAIALFLLPVSFIMHNFWTLQGLPQTIEMASFMKNMGLLASALMFLSIPQPWALSLEDKADSNALNRRTA